MTQSVTNTVLSIPLSTVLLFVLVLVFIALAILVGIVLQFGARLRYLASPVYDQIVKEAEQKAEKILLEARERSRLVQEQASDAAEKAFATRAAEDEEFRKEQVTHIEELTKHAKDLLNRQTVTITQLSESIAGKFSKETEAAIQTLSEETERMKKTFEEVGVKVKQDYDVLVKQTRDKMEEELDNEVRSARDAVKAYRTERIALLNKEIVSLVEDTARIALKRSLSLDQHRDLILNSLEEAKQEGVFTKSA